MEDTQEEQVGQTEVNETEPVSESEPQAEKGEEFEIPVNWEQGIKDLFSSGILDQAGKKAVFDKIKNYERGYQNKFHELDKKLKAYEDEKKEFDSKKAFYDEYSAFDKSIDPSMRGMILARYGNLPHYMEALHQMDIMASRQPAEFIKNYCINNGITAEALQEFLSGQGYRNAYQEHQQISGQEELKAQIMKEMEQKQQEQRYQQEVLSFANAKDGNGQSIHPFMADQSFVADMDKLQTAYPDKSLEELYQMAMYLRPDLRKQAIDDEAKKIAEAKDVEKAKSAIGVKTQIPTHGARSDKSWLQVLDEKIPV